MAQKAAAPDTSGYNLSRTKLDYDLKKYSDTNKKQVDAFVPVYHENKLVGFVEYINYSVDVGKFIPMYICHLIWSKKFHPQAKLMAELLISQLIMSEFQKKKINGNKNYYLSWIYMTPLGLLPNSDDAAKNIIEKYVMYKNVINQQITPIPFHKKNRLFKMLE